MTTDRARCMQAALPAVAAWPPDTVSLIPQQQLLQLSALVQAMQSFAEGTPNAEGSISHTAARMQEAMAAASSNKGAAPAPGGAAGG